jgi:hypothetical protein
MSNPSSFAYQQPAMLIRSPPRLADAHDILNDIDPIPLPPPILTYVPINLSSPPPPPIITTQIGPLTIRENVPRELVQPNRPVAFRAVLGLTTSFGRLRVE